MDRPISIAMAALGGQGGGVLTGWLVETAEANGYIAQSTYVCRRGATNRGHRVLRRDVSEGGSRSQGQAARIYAVPGAG